jgi:hypothetical protein
MSRYDTLREAVVSDDFELFLETHLGILNITATDADYNLLHFSILHKQYKSVEWLLKNGADPEIRNHNGKTCIEEAIISFDPIMISIISKYTGFNINAYDKNGHTYVHQHICTGNLNLLSVFYNKKPEIDFHKPTQYGLSTIDLLMRTLVKIIDASIRLNRIRFVQSICDKEEIFIFPKENKENKENNGIDFSSNLISFNAFIYDIFTILKINDPYKILIKIMNQPRNLEHIRQKVSGQDFFTYLLMNNYLTDNYEIEAITCLINSGTFNIDDINDSGLNIFQFIIKNRPSVIGFLEHILHACTLKSKVLNIFSICPFSNVEEFDIKAEYKAFRRRIKSYVTKDVLLTLLSLSSNPSNIISTLNSMSFHWKKIINAGDIIPFKCCNLFVWALKNDIPLAKVFLESTSGSSTGSSDATGSSNGGTVNGIDWNSFIMTKYCHNDDKISDISKSRKYNSKDTSCSSPFSIAQRGGSKFTVIRDLILERLTVPFNPTEYFSISDIKNNQFLQNLVEKGLIQLSHWIQASPQILIQNFPRSLWKCISLQERLPINKLTISGKPISSIPTEYFVILSNSIAWDIRELYSYIKSTPSNLFDSNDTLIDPSFIGPIIKSYDLDMVSYYTDPNPRHPAPDTPDFINYYYKALFRVSFSPNDISLLRKWTNIMISYGSDFNRELATFLKNPLSLDLYKKTITDHNKKNTIIPSDLVKILSSNPDSNSSIILPIIVQLRETALNQLLSWYIDQNDTQQKVFVSFLSITISSIEPSSDNIFSCGIHLKHKLDTLASDDLHLFNGIDLI